MKIRIRQFDLADLPFSQGYAVNAINQQVAGTLEAAGEAIDSHGNGNLIYTRFSHSGVVKQSESIWRDGCDTLKCEFRRTDDMPWNCRTHDGWERANNVTIEV